MHTWKHKTVIDIPSAITTTRTQNSALEYWVRVRGFILVVLFFAQFLHSHLNTQYLLLVLLPSLEPMIWQYHSTECTNLSKAVLLRCYRLLPANCTHDHDSYWKCYWMWKACEKVRLEKMDLAHNDVILQKTLQHLLSQILQMRRNVIHNVIMCRHTRYYTKLIVLFSVVYTMLFITPFKYITSVLFLYCVTMCSYASTRAESVGYCEAVCIACMCACVSNIGAGFNSDRMTCLSNDSQTWPEH